MAPPRDTRNVFVVERGGTVRLLVDGALRARPFLDIRHLVQTSTSRESERGLLSIAFAPDYSLSGRFYVYYTSRRPPASGTGDIAVDEFRRGATDPEVADPGDLAPDPRHRPRRLREPQRRPARIRAGRALYAGTGDGGGAGDPLRSGQNPGSPLGKVLRLDPVGGSPASVWSSGAAQPIPVLLRPADGRPHPRRRGPGRRRGDRLRPQGVRLGTRRELRLEHPRGARYGAGAAGPGGRASLRGYVASGDRARHSAGWCSITGGYVVRDAALPGSTAATSTATTAGRALRGQPDGLRREPRRADRAGRERAELLGEDGCGRLYAASIDGPIYRLVTTGPARAGAVPFAVPGDGPAGPRPGQAPTQGQAPGPAARRCSERATCRSASAENELCRVAASGKVLGPGAPRGRRRFSGCGAPSPRTARDPQAAGLPAGAAGTSGPASPRARSRWRA